MISSHHTAAPAAPLQFPRVPLNAVQRGMEMFLNMCREMEEIIDENVPDGHPDGGLVVGDLCQLQQEYRGQRGFRPLLLERLSLARELGPEVEAGFCAVASHVIALEITGCGGRLEQLESAVLNARL